MSPQPTFSCARERARALALFACVLLAACGEERVRRDDAGANDAATADAPDGAASQSDGSSANADAANDAAEDASAEDAAEEDASTEDAGGEDPDACRAPDPDTLTATIDPAWQVVESIVPPRRMTKVSRFVADEDGLVLTLENDPEIGRVWGTWPDIAPTNRTFDPRPPEFVLPFSEGDFRSENGITVVTFDEHVFVLAKGEPPVALPARDALSARVLGEFLFVTARAVGRGVETFDPDATIDSPMWRLPLDDLRNAFPERVLDAPGEISSVHRIAIVGTRAFALSAEPTEAFTPAPASLRAFDTSALSGSSVPLTLAAPNLIDELFEDLRTFEIAGGFVLWHPDAFEVPLLRVGRPEGEGVAFDQPLALPDRCTRLTHAFSVLGDLVVGLEHRSSNALRLVRLRRR